jgi:hypothetical protein
MKQTQMNTYINYVINAHARREHFIQEEGMNYQSQMLEIEEQQ